MTSGHDLSGPGALLVHASAVAHAGGGLLIRGASGTGKSSLALDLMALGADLVADDRVILRSDPDGGPPVLTAPERLRGLIEARGFGLLAAAPARRARLRAIVDLDHESSSRLPDPLQETVLGCDIPVFHKTGTRHFPAILMQYLKGGIWTRI